MGVAGARIGQELQYGERRYGFARSRFADQGYGFTACNLQGSAAHGFEGLGFDVEAHA